MDKIVLSGFADEISSSLDRQIQVLKKLGISHMEIRGVEKKGIDTYTTEEVKEIKGKLDDQGIAISSLASPIGKINIKDDFTPHLEHFKHVAELAHVLNTRYIRMFSFYMPKDANPADYREEVFARLKVLIQEAEKTDIVLLHENEKGIYGDTDLRCLDLMENLGCDHFRAVFDFANFIQCGVETVPAYQRLKPYIDYIHIKDAVAETGTVVPPGMGDGHLAEILAGFKADGYTGFLSLEPHLTNFTGLSGLEKDADHRDTVLTGEQAFTLAHDSLIDILKKI